LYIYGPLYIFFVYYEIGGRWIGWLQAQTPFFLAQKRESDDFMIANKISIKERFLLVRNKIV
jgi:hypothetical protein